MRTEENKEEENIIYPGLSIEFQTCNQNTSYLGWTYQNTTYLGCIYIQQLETSSLYKPLKFIMWKMQKTSLRFAYKTQRPYELLSLTHKSM